jgi:phosphohistidine phosphatase
MKKLYILRHAKSSWKDMNLEDFDRPLNGRGKRDAPFIGSLLKQKGIKPDMILSSPANRAKSTIKLIAKEIEYNSKIIFKEEIYESTTNLLYKMLCALKDDVSVVVLCGHNPELNLLANKLVGFNENIVTCGVVEIEFDINNWNDIDSTNAKMLSYEFPKKYL